MVSVHDLEGRYLRVSREVEAMLGYRAADLIGRSAYELFHPDDLAAVEESHRGVVETQDVPTAVYRIRRKDGLYVWFETRSYTVPERSEIIAITRARQGVDHPALDEAESDMRFRLAMHHAPIGMAIVGLDGRFLEVNRSLCELVGYSAEELVALTFADITHPEDLEVDLSLVEKVRAGKISSYQMHKRYLHRDGGPVWVELTVAMVRGGSGAPLYYLAQIQDITERLEHVREIEATSQALARSNEELERFAYVASHDLKEPLRKICAFGDRLERIAGESLSPEAQDTVRRMQRSAARMTALIDDVLAFSRVNAEPASRKPVDLDEVLQSVLSSLSVRIDDAGAEVRATGLGVVEAERFQMEQLLQNLIANALQYRRPEVAPVIQLGARRVEARPHDGATAWLELTVADNGIGFAPEDAERIFGAFQRLHRKHEHPGSGVGLAICKKVVEGHGGAIRAEGRPGEGATFFVRLPLGAEPEGRPQHRVREIVEPAHSA